MSEYEFIKELNVGEGKTEREQELRLDMNRIIVAYNNWILDDDCDLATVGRVQRYLAYGRQTLASESAEFAKLLERMERFVRSRLTPQELR